MKLLFLALMLFSFFVSAGDFEELKNAQGISEYLRFDNQTEVKKLGTLKDKFIVYNYTLVWGQAKRASNRIIILDTNYSMLGMYDISQWATSIEDNCIMFPFDADVGNKICLTEGALPKMTWLDGENPELYK